MKKIAIATATRAEYGILHPLLVPSFDLYPNFEVRGREFKSIVNALK